MATEGIFYKGFNSFAQRTFGTAKPHPTNTVPVGHPTQKRPQPGDGTRGRINRQRSDFKR